MATNVVSLIMQFLTPDIIARIAATLGLGRTEAQTGISAAVPALLAAFSGVADKPGGSQTGRRLQQTRQLVDGGAVLRRLAREINLGEQFD